MRGQTIKGKPNSGRAVLSYEQDNIKSHTHSASASNTDLGTKPHHRLIMELNLRITLVLIPIVLAEQLLQQVHIHIRYLREIMLTLAPVE